MEMVTAMRVSVNAQLIMTMHKIAHIMDVSTHNKPLCFHIYPLSFSHCTYLSFVQKDLKWPML